MESISQTNHALHKQGDDMARVEYTLVTGIGTHDFALEITRLLNLGWELSGALHVHVDDNGVRFTRELTKVHEHGVPDHNGYVPLQDGCEASRQ